MPTWHRISADKCIDIAGYYTASRIITTTDTISSLSDIQGPLTDQVDCRWPVRNREPRTPISSMKRALIHERDGGACRYCNRNDTLLVVDHIIPRSAFPADQLRIADRSDNLHSACWECNEERSNFDTFHTKRLGIAPCCLDCTEIEPTTETRIPAYCARCGVSQVPEIDGWIC
jgi:hypothetical protein